MTFGIDLLNLEVDQTVFITFPPTRIQFARVLSLSPTDDVDGTARAPKYFNTSFSHSLDSALIRLLNLRETFLLPQKDSLRDEQTEKHKPLPFFCS